MWVAEAELRQSRAGGTQPQSCAWASQDRIQLGRGVPGAGPGVLQGAGNWQFWPQRGGGTWKLPTGPWREQEQQSGWPESQEQSIAPGKADQHAGCRCRGSSSTLPTTLELEKPRGAHHTTELVTKTLAEPNVEFSREGAAGRKLFKLLPEKGTCGAHSERDGTLQPEASRERGGCDPVPKDSQARGQSGGRTRDQRSSSQLGTSSVCKAGGPHPIYIAVWISVAPQPCCRPRPEPQLLISRSCSADGCHWLQRGTKQQHGTSSLAVTRVTKWNDMVNLANRTTCLLAATSNTLFWVRD